VDTTTAADSLGVEAVSQQNNHQLVRNSHLHEQDSKIAETINKLKVRCAVRGKFLDILNPLIKLNTLITLYILVFVFLPKYVLSIVIQFNVTNNLINFENQLFETFNGTSEAELATVASKLSCCYFKSDLSNSTVFIGSNNGTCQTSTAGNNCVTSLEDGLRHYLRLIISVLYATATLNLFLKLISLFNFKYWLVHCLLYKFKANEDQLCKEYDECRANMFRKKLEYKMEQSEEYWAENFLNINKLNSSSKEGDGFGTQESVSSGGGGSDSNDYDNNLLVKANEATKTLPVMDESNSRYLNYEMENFLNEEERRAIELIDEATNGHLSKSSSFANKTNTFKAAPK
jgi:hypothetical protein